MHYRKQANGFTLIELIIVIVILGILSAVALPKFVNFSSDARAATLSGLLGAVKSANSMAVSYAQLKRVEDKLNQDVTFPDGSVVRFDYGQLEHSWETAWQYLLEGTFTLKTSGGLCDAPTDWCVDSDFNIGADVTVAGSSSAVVFWPKGTNTSDNCYVYYAYSASSRGNEPSIGEINTGC
ncbi:prepilin-type N-terminal cleavage/methylation domain-containing protein [Aliiglaciecola litoralis]|uniref:Prepilin-type N-terminal cleavage/methylation domain-containing protein n=1 Tax=Aliiglaciecola litoralis TaxID=582857 RepID=A0ABN1LD47_9ALTE